MLYFELKRFHFKICSQNDCGYFLGYSTTAKAYKVFNARTKVVEETLDVKFNELSSMKIPANLAELFDLEKFTFENTAVKTNSAGPSEDTTPDYGYEVIIPQRSATKGKALVVQNNCQSSTTATSTVVDQSSPSTTASTSSTTADKSPQTVDKSQQWSTPLPPIPPPFEATTGSSKSPAVVSSDDTHLQPSPTNAIIPYQGDLIFLRSHPPDQIIGNINEGVLTRSQTQNICLFAGFLSLHQPVKYQEALKDNSWVEAMQEELQQFKRQQVWELVPLPKEVSPIGTKWVFKNKTDERGIVVKNKARLVVQGYRQEEGIDYDETFAPVARLEAIRLFLAFAVNHNMKVFQMDIKSAFLYGTLQEEVYVCQPPGFEDPFYPDHVYRLNKALYGLKQAPRAWYETLSNFLLSNGFKRGTIDKTLFLKWRGKDLMIVQIYVDDIIFGSTCTKMCEEFRELMTVEFEMSAMGELQCFLGLQVQQMQNGTFIHQSKYAKELLTKFDMNDCKPCSTPMATNKLVMSDEKDELIDQTLYRSMIGSLLYLTASRPDIMFATCVCARSQSAPRKSNLIAVKRIIRYIKGAPTLGIWYPANGNIKLSGFSDSDFAGCHTTRKSTSGGCQFLGDCLVSWQSKKQAAVSTSTAEAEYIAAASCTAQLLWLQNQLLDFGITALKTPLMLDSQAAENIIKNPVSHSTTKHIDIRHHFVRDCYEKGLISLHHVPTKDQLADMLTKALDTATFESLVSRIGMLNME
ncbi:putative RNA-directed DNA polymerase [Helianthus annuus]|uniref:RNA-directed DNA polymerase n=1 Tax=Helianthus annuus TaxID=4232 RepID=A0A9K3H7U5_HELAN|nr:putative RNA-directed DNA polymerase [Helianthus annuus]